MPAFPEEAPSPVGARYVPASAKTPPQPGEKIASLFSANLSSPFVLQRLTGRTYWVQRYFYSTTFYVGDEGVLLFDPLEGRGPALLEAVRTVTDRPVTAVVYSHDHADHIADTPAVLDAMTGSPVRIVASRATAEKMRYLGSSHPVPEEIVDWPRGSFTFEDLTVELHGFTRAAHADDHAAWLLREERVLHTPDLINPDQPPFWRFGGSENFVYLPGNLRQIRDLDWAWLNGGHGNIGERTDVDFTLGVLDDYIAATRRAMADQPFEKFIDPSATNAHSTFMTSWIDAAVRQAVEELRPRYGSLYGFDASTPSNIAMVLHTLLSYR